MNLSTSNFKHSDKQIKSARKLYRHVVFKLGTCMLMAILIIYGYLSVIGATGQGVFGRVTEARQAMPQIIDEPNDLVMFFGSSMTRAAISPRQFDRKMTVMGKAVTSFNFGFGGLNPYFQDFLSRRITEDIDQHNRKFKLVMIEFNPFQTTTARWDRAQSEVDSLLTLVASDKELLDIARQDIGRGVRLFNIKYLRAGISAEMITTYFAYELFPPIFVREYQDDDLTRAKQRELGHLITQQFDIEYPNYVSTQWSYEWRGAGTIPEERSAKTLALFDEYYNASFTDARMKNDRLGRIRSADIESLNFAPLLVEHFINIVKNFQLSSEHVKVVMLPKNSKWIKTTAKGEQRLANAIKQIEQATGIKIDNHQDIPEISPQMFRDTTHLARYRGDIVYTDYLVNAYADLID